MPEIHQVTIGEETFTIQRFRGLKAIMAIAAMTRIGREVPDVLADAVKEYTNRNTVSITEEMSNLPRWAGVFKKEDFDKAEERTGKRIMEVPAPMTQNEQMLYALPTLLEKARKEVARLLALLIIPNAELTEADDNDTVPQALDKYYKLLMHEAEIDQLIDLALATSEVLQEQLADRKDRLGNLTRGLWSLFRRNQSQPALAPTSRPQNTDPTQAPTVTTTPATSTDDAPTSSTSSKEPTDGTGELLSTASLGASS